VAYFKALLQKATEVTEDRHEKSQSEQSISVMRCEPVNMAVGL
jgi:hypothetical protein